MTTWQISILIWLTNALKKVIEMRGLSIGFSSFAAVLDLKRTCSQLLQNILSESRGKTWRSSILPMKKSTWKTMTSYSWALCEESCQSSRLIQVIILTALFLIKRKSKKVNGLKKRIKSLINLQISIIANGSSSVRLSKGRQLNNWNIGTSKLSANAILRKKKTTF